MYRLLKSKEISKPELFSWKYVALRLGVRSSRALLKALRELEVIYYNGEENLPKQEFVKAGYFITQQAYYGRRTITVIKTTITGYNFICHLIYENPELFQK